MTLGEVFKQAAEKDITGSKELLPSGKIQALVRYTEEVKGTLFVVKLVSASDPEAFVEASIPYDGTAATENYVRLHFLSMVFNAAVFGMKRKKKDPRPPPGREN